MLSLGDHAPLPSPAVQRAPGQIGEAADCLTTRGQALGFSGGELVGDGIDQALVARETEDVVDTVRLSPSHQLVAGKARIGAEDDLHPRPPGPDLASDARDLGHGAGRDVATGAWCYN